MKKERTLGALALAGALLMAAALSSCGQGAPEPQAAGAAPSAASKVAVLRTDCPTREGSRVMVTFTEIQLASHGGKVTVFSGEGTFDLLDLENETALVTLAGGVPAGTYNKIRLRVSGVELYGPDGALITEPPVKLRGKGKLDLKPKKPFTVEPGETLALRLDFDARKSIKLFKNKKMYVLRPVIFVDVIKIVQAPAPAPDPVPSARKLLRVTGAASAIDAGAGAFQLLSAQGGGAVEVDASGASFFNAASYGGPASIANLAEGGTVTVLGTMDGAGAIHAAVVEIGPFTKLTGTIASGVDPASGRFLFVPDPASENPNPYPAILQSGTKIYSSGGDPLDASALADGVRAELDAFVIYGDLGPPILNTAFISVGGPGADEQALPATVSAASVVSEAPCVTYAEDASVMLLTSGADWVTSEYVDMGALEAGEEADLYGAFDPATGCFEARTVVVEREK